MERTCTNSTRSPKSIEYDCPDSTESWRSISQQTVMHVVISRRYYKGIQHAYKDPLSTCNELALMLLYGLCGSIVYGLFVYILDFVGVFGGIVVLVALAVSVKNCG